MPASTMSLAWADGSVEVSPQAGVRVVVPGIGAVRFAIEGLGEVQLVLIDDDAAEHEGRRGEVGVEQRVLVSESCLLRWVSDTPAGITAPELALSVTHDSLAGWVWPARADGVVALWNDTGSGPVLVVRARQADLTLLEEEAGHLRLGLTGELTRGRRVTLLQLDIVESLRQVGAGMPPWSHPCVVAEGEAWEAPLADVGLDAGDEVVSAIDVESGLVGLSAPPGRHRIGLHTRRGISEVVLEVAPSWSQVLADQVARFDPRGLANAAQALIMLRAAASGAIEVTDSREDAFDRFDWSQREGLLAIAFGAERALLEGEPSMAEAAMQRMAGQQRGPGSARVHGLVAAAAAALRWRNRPTALAEPLVGWARLEVDLAAGERSARAVTELNGLIARLGEDLPGRPLGLGALDQAVAVGLLEFVHESWPEAPRAARTAHLTRQRLLAGYAADAITDPEPLAWLLLAG